MAVVETASFTAAALRLHATQSGVSQRIAKLEHQLKVQLFLRTPQGATATLAGRQLYQRASAILGLLSEAETELGLFAGGLEGSIHIGLMPALMRSVAGPVQRRLIAQHPNLEIRLTELVNSDLIQSVLRGEIDFAIVPRFDAPDSVLMTSLGSTYEVLVLANRYIENHGQPVDLGQQRPLSLVLQSPGSIRRDSILERLKSAGIKVDQVVNIDSMFGTFEYIEATDFAAILPAVMMLKEAENRQLCIRPILKPRMDLGLIAIENKVTRHPSIGALLKLEYASELAIVDRRLATFWHGFLPRQASTPDGSREPD